MRSQVNLDFLMKFFISVVAVVFLVLALYFFGASMAKYFGMSFKLTHKGVNGGNLDKVKLNILSSSDKVITYSSCISYCNDNKVYTGGLNCKDFCSGVCNNTGTEGCVAYKYRVDLFVPSSQNGISFSLSNKYFSLGTNQYNVFPGNNIYNLTFIVPYKDNTMVISKLFTSYNGIEVVNTTSVYTSCSFIGFSCSSDSDCCDYYASTNKILENLNETNTWASSNLGNPEYIILSGTLFSPDDSQITLTVSNTSYRQVFTFDNNTAEVYNLNVRGNINFSVTEITNPFNLSLSIFYSDGVQKGNVFCNTTTHKCELMKS